MTSAKVFPRIVNAGADALIVYFSDTISEKDNQRVIALKQRLQQSDLALLDLVPAYSSLMIYYDVLQTDEATLRRALQPYLAEEKGLPGQSQHQTFTIDVYYDESVGPDIQHVMKEKQLNRDQLISLHTQSKFRVYALGFAPGFAYLGSLPDKLIMPRLRRPRERVPTGSVAIAEQQTAIYPLPSPGGWNIIGRTAKPLYEPEKGIISALEVGDSVQFRAISKAEFIDQGGRLEQLDD
ncbi:5-oxoprolinase subunit PxpB [Idiomarina seosinensis]|uniref:5-oxoprolinase subunit PxpB n=1 Tax=Idiomarina seosinensis TaxID=281739 RepID=UPI00384D3429